MSETFDQETIEKVIARAQKMLSRTKDSSGTTEAEADTAMRLVQEMLSKYNLDLAVVEAAQAKSADKVSVERVREEVKGKAMYKWQRQLAKYVAEANFCYHLIKKDSEWVKGHYKLNLSQVKEYGLNAKDYKKELTHDEYWDLETNIARNCYDDVPGRYKSTHQHIFVGRKGNVITAQLMYNYLTETIEDLVPVASNAQRLSRSAMSWKEGASDRLCERLAAKRKDLIEKHDARAKAEQEAQQEEMERKRQEASKKPKAIAPNEQAEVQNIFDNLASDAYDLSDNVPEHEEQERPEEDPDDDWTPTGEEVPEVETGSALVLASVYDESEREANYEVAHGLEPGSLAKWRKEQADRIAELERQAAEQEAKEEIEGIEAPVKKETERQRQARIRREQKEYQARRARWAREDARAAAREEREFAKRDHKAYYAGAEKAKTIGLDTQVSRTTSEPKKLS